MEKACHIWLCINSDVVQPQGLMGIKKSRCLFPTQRSTRAKTGVLLPFFSAEGACAWSSNTYFWFSAHMSLTVEHASFFNQQPCLCLCFCQFWSHNFLDLGKRLLLKNRSLLPSKITWSHLLRLFCKRHSRVIIFTAPFGFYCGFLILRSWGVATPSLSTFC